MPRGIIGKFVLNPVASRVEDRIKETGAEVTEWGKGPWSNVDVSEWGGGRFATGITRPERGERLMASVHAVVGGRRMEVARRDSWAETGWAWARVTWLPALEGEEVIEYGIGD